jgi:glucosamine 6-phosphate synthetase-like amidotransferase/phosphosugar isomerase protein
MGEKITGRRVAMNEDMIKIDKFVLLGRGSSYFLALTEKYLFDKITNISTSCAVTNVFESYQITSIDKHTALFFHSHSGKSEGDIQVVKDANLHGAFTIGITDIASSPLAAEVDRVILGPGGSKVELPATRTYASAMYRMMLLALKLGNEIGDSRTANDFAESLHEIPSVLRGFIPNFESKAEKIAQEIITCSSFVFVGVGPNLSTADEASMAFSQATGLPSQAFEMENYIHGPMQALGTNQCVMIIAPEGPLQDRILRLAQACQIIGAKTVVLAPKKFKSHLNIDTFVEMPAGIPDILSPVVYMVPLWQIGYRLGLFGKGSHPDRLSMDREEFKEAFSFLMKKDKWVTQK